MVEDTATNNTLATALVLDEPTFWDIDEDENIANSTEVPHVSIQATGNGTFDYFRFSVNPGVTGIFDIDFGLGSGGDIDTQLFLYGVSGDNFNILTENDTSDVSQGGLGSTSVDDAFLEWTFEQAGEFIIGVGAFFSFDSGFANEPGLIGSAPAVGATYTLNISIPDHEFSDLPPRLPGDANLDGSVGLADFTILKNNFGISDASWEDGNFTEELGDTNVDLADFNILKTNFGATQATVPEPSSLLLLCLGLFSCAAGRVRFFR